MPIQPLTTTQVGDILALRERNSWRGITHRLLVVDRITTAQVCCRNADGGGGEWRFRKSDGKQIGENYTYAEIATPELIAKVKAQQEERRRTLAARTALKDLEGKHLHQLSLSLEQLEALAMAWGAIKAMKA